MTSACGVKSTGTSQDLRGVSGHATPGDAAQERLIGYFNASRPPTSSGQHAAWAVRWAHTISSGTSSLAARAAYAQSP